MKIQKVWILLTAILVFLVQRVDASDALLISDVGTSAKMLGMGQIEGFDDSAIAIFENPAALYRVENHSVSLFTTKLFEEVQFRNAAYSYKTPKGTFALGYMSAGVDDIPKTFESVDSEGVTHNMADSYFGVNHSIYKLGYHYDIHENLHFGGSVNYYYNTIDTVKGSGVNADLGLIYTKGPLVLSGTLKNVVRSSHINYSSHYSEALPFQTVWGAQYHIGYFDFLGQYRTTSAYDHGFKSAGVHFNPSFMKFFHVRGGYKEIVYLDKVSHHGTFGIGLSLKSVSFDYAYEKSDVASFDNNNYFSVSLEF